MDAKPTVYALDPLLEALDAKEVARLCKKTRRFVSDDERAALLDTCFRHSHAQNIEEGLSWASAADIALYNEELRQAQSREEERERESAARAAQMRADSEAYDRAHPSRPAPATRAASEPNPSVDPMVQLRSDCPHSVTLFIGHEPKFGSGSYENIESNSITNVRRGEMWIVDDSHNGLSSTTPGPSTRSVTITASCGGFTSD